ncbi:MAG: Maf family protein [Fimbriimonadaceae bacterium]|nr:Maf family protein [Alphaproteobacteria bacterium]
MTPPSDKQDPPLILASASSARAELLRAAGLTVEIVPAQIDEAAIRRALDDSDTPLPTEDVAVILAETKALEVSAQKPGALVIGGDQILAFENDILAKPDSVKSAYLQLSRLSGKSHRLQSAIVCALNGETIWRHVAAAHMTMRPLTPEFIDSYLTRLGPQALTSVGAYQLEGLGIQLFEKIEGDYFTILGLPMLPLLAFLRSKGYLQG